MSDSPSLAPPRLARSASPRPSPPRARTHAHRYTGMMWNMCDQETGMWVDSFVGGLSPLWDAGTDSGVTYTSPDEVTVPVGTACQYWPVTPECGIGADHPTQTTVFANQNAAGEPWYVANWTVYQVEPPASDAGGAYTGGTTKH